jgi:hypothetical protein
MALTKTPQQVYRGGTPADASYWPVPADAQVLAEEMRAEYQEIGSDLDALEAEGLPARVNSLETIVTSGQRVLDPVAVLADSNLTLSGEQTIDGTLTSTSRVAVTGQTDATENGIYTTAAGAWSRVSEMNASAEIDLSTVYVEGGTAYGGETWKFTVADPDTFVLGTDDIDAVKVGDAGSVLDYVDGQIATKADTSSPTLTGTPTAPTPAAGDDSTKIATTAYVQGEIEYITPPGGIMAFNEGVSVPDGWFLYSDTEIQRAANVTVTSGTEGETGAVYTSGVAGQWYADAVAIEGEDGETYMLDAANQGAQIACCGKGHDLTALDGFVCAFEAGRIPKSWQDTTASTAVTADGDDLQRLDSVKGDAYLYEDTDFPVYGYPIDMTDKHFRMVRQSLTHSTTGYTQLPVSSLRPNNPTGSLEVSFTNTGLARHPSGVWLVSQFGKGVDADSINSSIVRMLPDLSAKLSTNGEINLSTLYGTNFTLQGIAWDTKRDVIWIADTTNNIIRALSFDGSEKFDYMAIDIGTELGADADISALAYDEARDLLLVGNQTSDPVYQIREYDPTNRVVGDVVTIEFNPDHITVFGDFIYATLGTNGVDGNVAKLRKADGVEVGRWMDITNADCIEGIVVEADGDNLTAYINHDGGFHYDAGDGADPQLGVITEVALTQSDISSPTVLPDMTLVLVLGFDAFPGSGSKNIIGWNDVQNADPGWAVQIQNNAMRFVCLNDGEGAAAARRETWDVTGYDDGNPHVFVIESNGVGRPTLRIDGAAVSGSFVNDFSTYTEGLRVDNLALGGAYNAAGSWVATQDADFKYYGHHISERISTAKRGAIEAYVAARDSITLG